MGGCRARGRLRQSMWAVLCVLACLYLPVGMARQGSPHTLTGRQWVKRHASSAETAPLCAQRPCRGHGGVRAT